jgi:hypothetical protein
MSSVSDVILRVGTLCDEHDPNLIGSYFPSFPGPLPVGLRRVGLAYMSDRHHFPNYVSTIKLDGVRCLLHISCQGMYLVDRSMNIYLVTRDIVSRSVIILDGELVESQKTHTKYFMAFDTLVMHGHDIRSMSFCTRYEFMRHFVAQHANDNDNSSLQVVCKRFHSLCNLSTLLSTMIPSGTELYTVDVTKIAVTNPPVSTYKDKDKDDIDRDTIYADGIIFMDLRAPYDCKGNDFRFGIMKWKRVPTIDLMIDRKDLCDMNGRPRTNYRIQTWYWEYDQRQGRSCKRPFQGSIILSSTQRRTLWEEGSHATPRPYMTCVECASSSTTTKEWSVLRGRPDKTRCNSARTIRDTTSIIDENIQVSTLTRMLHPRDNVSPAPSHSLLSPMDMYQLSSHFTWLGYTWLHGPRSGELEIRLMENGTPNVSLSLFQKVLSRLERADNMIRYPETHMIDYTCGPVRVTVDPSQVADTRGIFKEILYVQDFPIQDLSKTILRCALACEDPDLGTKWTQSKAVAEHSTRREKHRTRFLHQNLVAIELTRVQTMDWKDSSGSTEHEYEYEIEMELLQGSAYIECPILTLLWRMLFYGLGIESPEKTLFLL